MPSDKINFDLKKYLNSSSLWLVRIISINRHKVYNCYQREMVHTFYVKEESWCSEMLRTNVLEDGVCQNVSYSNVRTTTN